MSEVIVYPVLSDNDVNAVDFFNNADAQKALRLLQHNPHEFVTSELTAGATGADADTYVFVAPTKMKVLDVKFITTVVQTGSGNTPTPKLLAGSNVVAATAAGIALAGAIGDVATLPLDDTKTTINAGTKLIFRITNAAGTITVPIQGKLQVTWRPTV